MEYYLTNLKFIEGFSARPSTHLLICHFGRSRRINRRLTLIEVIHNYVSLTSFERDHSFNLNEQITYIPDDNNAVQTDPSRNP
jgi:hypothetical protein